MVSGDNDVNTNNDAFSDTNNDLSPGAVVLVSHPASFGSSHSLVSALKCVGAGHFCNKFKKLNCSAVKLIDSTFKLLQCFTCYELYSSWLYCAFRDMNISEFKRLGCHVRVQEVEKGVAPKVNPHYAGDKACKQGIHPGLKLGADVTRSQKRVLVIP